MQIRLGCLKSHILNCFCVRYKYLYVPTRNYNLLVKKTHLFAYICIPIYLYMYTDIFIYVYGYIYICIYSSYNVFIFLYYSLSEFPSVLVISSETSFNYRRPCAIHYGAP